MPTIKAIYQSHPDLDRIDIDLLMMKVLNCSRVFLLTYPETTFASSQYDELITLLKRRRLGEPVAYILGKKAFWDIELDVTPDVLIPRPETELIVEWVLSHLPWDTFLKIADLGTGSGAIALSIAKARPQWQVLATDLSEQALSVAKSNAKKYALENVEFYQGAWCDALPSKKVDVIVSNPPYIDANDEHLSQGDVRFEPTSALVAKEDGLADLFCIAREARAMLKKNGYLLLEHGYKQGPALREYLVGMGYTDVQTLQDFARHERITLAKLSVVSKHGLE